MDRKMVGFGARICASAMGLLLLGCGACMAQPAHVPSRERAIRGQHAAAKAATASAEIAQFRRAMEQPGSLLPATRAQREHAADVVTAQLKAFRSGNFARAVQYQSPGLRSGLGSVQQFRLMMSEVYPEITASRTVEFGAAEASRAGRYVLLPATLTGQDGVSVQAMYVLIAQRSDYRIMTVLGGMNPRPLRRAPYDPRMV